MYELLQLSHAARHLRRLHKNHHLQVKAISQAITNLADNPRPPSATRLVNRTEWRIRVGDFRVLYEIDDVARTVTIVAIANRRDVYG